MKIMRIKGNELKEEFDSNEEFNNYGKELINIIFNYLELKNDGRISIFLNYNTRNMYEFTAYNGCLYERTKYNWEDEMNSHFSIVGVEKQKNYNGIDILCECGNTEFTLNYIDYGVNAICTKCKKSATVYSG